MRNCTSIAAANACIRIAPISAGRHPLSSTLPSSSNRTDRSRRCRWASAASGADWAWTIRQVRQIRSSWLAVANRAKPNIVSSVAAVVTRVSARTLEYDSRPAANASATSGSSRSRRATRTRSRAAGMAMPSFQFSQWAHDRVCPSAQPPNSSNSAISPRKRDSPANRSEASRAISVPNASTRAACAATSPDVGVSTLKVVV